MKYIVLIVFFLLEVRLAQASCSVVINSSVETCPATCNGWLSFSDTSNGATYLLVLNSDTLTFTDSLRLDGLCAGTFNYWLSDSLNTCVDSGSIQLVERGALTVHSTDESCNSSCNASVSFYLPYTGAVHSVEFNGITTYFFDSLSFTGLCPGAYSYSVSGLDTACRDIGTVVLADHIPLSVSLTPYTYPSGYNIQCNGDQSGSISAQVTGGNPPYSFVWSSGDQSQDLLGITAGTYQLQVTDSLNCTVQESVTLTEPPSLDPFISGTYFSITNVSCFGGSDGELIIHVNGGTPPYYYSWSTGDNTETISNEPAGLYSVLIWDDSGCLTSSEATITQPGPMLLTTFSTASDCRSASGSASVTVIGGTPGANGYNYSWSPTGDTTTSISNVNGGNYVLSVTDANGCVQAEAVVVPFISQPVLQPNIIANVRCNGDSDGVATVSVISGLSPFTYSWATSPPQTADTAIGLSAGSYVVAVTDSNGCTSIDAVTISEPPALSVIASALSVLRCAPDSDGTAAVMIINGGEAPYSYQWFPYGGTDSIAYGLAYGNYSVIATDAQGCTFSAPLLVDAPPLLTLTGMVGNVRCFGNADGIISLTVSGGTGNYTYAWSPAVFGTFYVTDLDTGNYHVEVSDTNGCVVADSFSVFTPPPLALTTTALPAGCFQAMDGAAAVSVSGGTPGYTYSWTSTGGTDSAVVNLPAGPHTVIVTDLNGCIDSAVAQINEPPAIALDIAVVPPSSQGCNDGLLQAAAADGFSPYTYSWDGASNSNRLLEPTMGMHTLCVADSHGCSSCDSIYWADSSFYNVSGFVYLDLNQNGIRDRGENGLPSFRMTIEPAGHSVRTGPEGRWVDNTLQDATYALVFDTSNTNWQLTVPPVQTISVVNGSGRAPDFGVVPTGRCPQPEVSVFASELSPCDTARPVRILITNAPLATAALTQSYLMVEADLALTLHASDHPVIYASPGVYRIETGDLLPGESKQVLLQFDVACAVVDAQTLCITTTLHPTDPCYELTSAATASWDSSFLAVAGECSNDSVMFTIINTGLAQQCSTAVRYFVEGTLIAVDSIRLAAGDTLIRYYYSNGHTARLEVDQHPHIPMYSQPVAVVEMCGTFQNGLPGFVTQQYYDDESPLVSQFCLPVNQPWSSFEKTGYPTGVTRDRFINPDQQLRYTISFENLAGDTTDVLVLRDTLDVHLDMNSVCPGIASHPYLFRCYGQRVLEWYFPNVHFPDILTDPSGSRGFVTYTVDQLPGLADYTVIRNTATVYQDSLPAITTNTTRHTIYRQQWLTTGLLHDAFTVAGIQLFPNPAHDQFYIRIPETNGPVNVEVQDLLGRSVYRDAKPIHEPIYSIATTAWSPGQYIVVVTTADGCFRGSVILH